MADVSRLPNSICNYLIEKLSIFLKIYTFCHLFAHLQPGEPKVGRVGDLHPVEVHVEGRPLLDGGAVALLDGAVVFDGAVPTAVLQNQELPLVLQQFRQQLQVLHVADCRGRR